jgi:hypothetical protein
LVAIQTGFTGIVEDVMRLELHCHRDIDLSQPAMQVQIRSLIARYLRDSPQSGEGVIALGGVEQCGRQAKVRELRVRSQGKSLH